jgi:allantoicase
MIDLITAPVGGRVVACNDEFFAAAENLITAAEPISNDEYTDRGKWMDGWETRRRREPGHDWCVLALGLPGKVEEVVVDTSFFTGNYAESFSLEGCGEGDDSRLEEANWEMVLPETGLTGDSKATFPVDNPHRFTHLRLNIFPDGGVARLRVNGTPIPDQSQVCPEDGLVDLLSMLVGGEALEASDVHYSPPSNLLRPTEPAGMWDGWETKRRRGPGNDWVVFRLGMPGTVESVVIDTRHFKGNAPGWISASFSGDGEDWAPALDRVPVSPHEVAVLDLATPVRAGFLKLDIHPDGGLARVKALGRPNAEAAIRLRLDYLNSLADSDALRFFRMACAARSWAEAMASNRPYPDFESVTTAAESSFDDLGDAGWLEAFAGHPRIGELGDETANREQAAAAGADQATLQRLAEVNRAYEDRFDFTYIVYATGKSAEEMLAIAESRLGNQREQEILNAGVEQRRISATRLGRMLCAGELT